MDCLLLICHHSQSVGLTGPLTFHSIIYDLDELELSASYPVCPGNDLNTNKNCVSPRLPEQGLTVDGWLSLPPGRPIKVV